jgi:hypothetical protein
MYCGQGGCCCRLLACTDAPCSAPVVQRQQAEEQVRGSVTVARRVGSQHVLMSPVAQRQQAEEQVPWAGCWSAAHSIVDCWCGRGDCAVILR